MKMFIMPAISLFSYHIWLNKHTQLFCACKEYAFYKIYSCHASYMNMYALSENKIRVDALSDGVCFLCRLLMRNIWRWMPSLEEWTSAKSLLSQKKYVCGWLGIDWKANTGLLTHLSVCLPACVCVSLSLSLFVSLSVCMSYCLSIFLSCLLYQCLFPWHYSLVLLWNKLLQKHQLILACGAIKSTGMNIADNSHSFLAIVLILSMKKEMFT